MTMSFREKWLESDARKNSVLCAGLDPAKFELGRGNKGLPKGADKIAWSLKYLDAVAPYCAALKPNVKYWEDEDDVAGLKSEIIPRARELGLVVIDDCKAADLSETNESGIFFSKRMGFDALTIAPYAGNMEETAMLCRKHDIGAITMCLMSNAEYNREKNALVKISFSETEEFSNDAIQVKDHPHVKRYVQLAHDAKKFGLDGVVIGAPSNSNHIRYEELENVKRYVGGDMLVLCPGVGEQKGEAGLLWRHFGRNNVIVNVGRALMFPKGSCSTPEEQAEAAKHYRNMLNEERAA